MKDGPVDIWEDREFAEAPYTDKAAKYKKAAYLGSTQGVEAKGLIATACSF